MHHKFLVDALIFNLIVFIVVDVSAIVTHVVSLNKTLCDTVNYLIYKEMRRQKKVFFQLKVVLARA